VLQQAFRGFPGSLRVALPLDKVLLGALALLAIDELVNVPLSRRFPVSINHINGFWDQRCLI
jgi:hypothetical protein